MLEPLAITALAFFIIGSLCALWRKWTASVILFILGISFLPQHFGFIPDRSSYLWTGFAIFIVAVASMGWLSYKRQWRQSRSFVPPLILSISYISQGFFGNTPFFLVLNIIGLAAAFIISRDQKAEKKASTLPAGDSERWFANIPDDDERL